MDLNCTDVPQRNGLYPLQTPLTPVVKDVGVVDAVRNGATLRYSIIYCINSKVIL